MPVLRRQQRQQGRRLLVPLAGDHRLIHQHHQQPVPLRRGGLFPASRKTNLWHSASPGRTPGSWPDALTTASNRLPGQEARSHEHDPDPGPGPVEYAPWCRDGSGHTNALPPDDQACISDEHTVELTPRRTCGWRARIDLETLEMYLLRERDARRPPSRSARGTSRLRA